MIKIRKHIVTLILLIVFCVHPAFAQVYTSEKTQDSGSCVYIAGNADNYPIEFYDNDKKAYCGIIPDILGIISERLGIDFVYINRNKTDKNNLVPNLQEEIISSSSVDDHLPYHRDYLELVSYKKGDKTIKSGLVFTSYLNDAVILKIKEAANEISPDAKASIYLSYATKSVEINYIWVSIFILLMIIIVMQILHIRRIRHENATDKMTDSETGMGNLQLFKYHLKNSIADDLRSLYYIAYIILDSSYLRSYHGDSSFEEVLKYTAQVISENTDNKEFSARITENGFAFAFRCADDEDARRRLTRIVNKLNSFKDMKEKNNKFVFHAAVYHLGNSDKNCEILLFNLRRNCNKIFGTERQIVYCDNHSMNKIQEEKKTTERILNGLENNEFKMYLQFIVENKTKKIVSAEALSRWDIPQKGILSPNKYILNMETSGLISRHDFYMFELACKQLEKWKGTDFKNIALSCNFTRITISEENFVEKIKTISNKYNFDKTMLAIEITEDAIEMDREIATQNVKCCKELGFKVYLDDLGSGYTSLANLCDYPIDVVKIDRDILLKTKNQKGKDLFNGIIALAHSINVNVTCEGVETDEQNDLVSASACDYIQGWYYSKALPLEQCEEFIRIYENRGRACDI